MPSVGVKWDAHSFNPVLLSEESGQMTLLESKSLIVLGRLHGVDGPKYARLVAVGG
jgi:hypothetical protein